MPHTTSKRKMNPEKVPKYVMFGFNRLNEDDIGFLGKITEYGKEKFTIVDDLDNAVFFPEKNIDNIKGFGTPQQWLEYWNSNNSLNFKFHLVKTNR